MASIAFTPKIHRPTNPTPRPKRPTKPTRISSSLSLQPSFSDPFVLQLAEALEDSLPSPSPPPLQPLRDSASESLLSTPWPSRRDEPFRFTDTSFIKHAHIHPVSLPPKPPSPSPHAHTHFPTLTIVDGFVLDSPSPFPDGVFVGTLSQVDAAVTERVGELLRGEADKDLFWSINGVGAPELGVVYVPPGCRVGVPVGLRYFSAEAGVGAGGERMPVSNPRVLVVVEDGGEVEIVEEFRGSGDGGDSCYWANAVLDVVVGERGKLRHCYVQRQSFNAAHIKWTSVRQVN